MEGGHKKPTEVAPTSSKAFPHPPGHSQTLLQEWSLICAQGWSTSSRRGGQAPGSCSRHPRLRLCPREQPLTRLWEAHPRLGPICMGAFGVGYLQVLGSNIPGCHLPPAHPRGQLPGRGAPWPGQGCCHLQVSGAVVALQAPAGDYQAEESSLFLELGPSPDTRIPAEISSSSN
jgi:hypothetical protein